MPTRRRFLASLASLAAAAGLARFARGGAAEPKAAAPTKVPEPEFTDERYWVPRATYADCYPRGAYVTVAFAVQDPQTGDSWVHHRIMRFDERGRLVEVSGLLPEA